MNLKVDLSNCLDNVYKQALVYIDLDEYEKVKDVIEYICSLYKINNDGRLVLSSDEWYIHPELSSNVFHGILDHVVLHPNHYEKSCGDVEGDSQKLRMKNSSQKAKESSFLSRNHNVERSFVDTKIGPAGTIHKSSHSSIPFSHDLQKESPNYSNSTQIHEKEEYISEPAHSDLKKLKKNCSFSPKECSTPQMPSVCSIFDNSVPQVKNDVKSSCSFNERTSKKNRARSTLSDGKNDSEMLQVGQSIPNSVALAMSFETTDSLQATMPQALESSQKHVIDESQDLVFSKRKKSKKDKKNSGNFTAKDATESALSSSLEGYSLIIENGTSSNGMDGGQQDTCSSFPTRTVSLQESSSKVSDGENDFNSHSGTLPKKRKRRHNKAKKVKQPFDFSQDYPRNTDSSAFLERDPVALSPSMNLSKRIVFNDSDEDSHVCSNEKKRRESANEELTLKDTSVYNHVSIDQSISGTAYKAASEIDLENQSIESDFAILNELQNSKQPVYFKRKRHVEPPAKTVIHNVRNDEIQHSKKDPPTGVMLNDVLSPEDEQTFKELIWLSQNKFNHVFYRKDRTRSNSNLSCEKAKQKEASEENVTPAALQENVSLPITSTNDHSISDNGNEVIANNSFINDKQEDDEILPPFVGYSAKSKKGKSFSSLANCLKNLRQNRDLASNKQNWDDAHDPVEKVSVHNCNGNANHHSEEINVQESQPIIVDISKDEELTNSSFQIENYEGYPVLRSLPKPGDIIAFKTMALDENFCPQYSDFYPAKVLALDGVQISMQPCLKGSKVNGNVQDTKSESFHLDWREMYGARLLYP